MKHLHPIPVFVLTVLLTLAVAAQASAGGTEAAPGIASSTFKIVLGKGQEGGNYSELGGTMAQGHKDTFLIIAKAAGTVAVTITDCCTMGDTMGAAALAITPGKAPVFIPQETAVSPATVDLSIPVSGPSLVLVVAGYVRADHFPSGYDWLVALQ